MPSYPDFMGYAADTLDVSSEDMISSEEEYEEQDIFTSSRIPHISSTNMSDRAAMRERGDEMDTSSGSDCDEEEEDEMQTIHLNVIESESESEMDDGGCSDENCEDCHGRESSSSSDEEWEREDIGWPWNALLDVNNCHPERQAQRVERHYRDRGVSNVSKELVGR